MKVNQVPSIDELNLSIDEHRGIITIRKDVFIKIYGVWYIIPKGMRSDGASLPFPVNLFIDGKGKDILLFSILHDYFYRTQFAPRSLADSIYYEGLKITSNKFIAASFYIALRLFGWVAWIKNLRKGLMHFENCDKRIRDFLCEGVDSNDIE